MKSMDLSGIDLNLLVAFEALYEERSVTLAAQRLYLGQPAMSGALNRLRTLFQDDLFVRMGREMQPTTKARTVAPEISRILKQVRQVLTSDQIFDPATTDVSFAIGSSDYTSFVMMPQVLQALQHQAPGSSLRLIGFEKDSVVELLESGAIDLALGVFNDLPPQIQQEPLFFEYLVGVARQGHPALQTDPLSLTDFAQLPQALATLRRDETGYIDQQLALHSLTRQIKLTTPHMLVMPYFLLVSDLVTALPSRIAKRLNCNQDLVTFDLPFDNQPWAVSMVWSKLTDKDADSTWLRQLLQQISTTL